MCPIKLRTKPIFRIFHVLKINMPFCNLFMGRPLYTVNHKKRDISLLTITLANLNRFL